MTNEKFLIKETMFEFMRSRVREFVEHYQTDLAVDIEVILTRYYEESDKPIAFFWMCRECGTELIFDNEEKYDKFYNAITSVHPENENNHYFHIELIR